MDESQSPSKTANTQYTRLDSDVQLSDLNSATEYVQDHDIEQKPPPRSPASWRQVKARQWREGWRFGASLGFLTCLLVLLLNIILTIWGALRSKVNHGHIFEGNCAAAKRYNMGLHVVINVLSTLMLGASNYSMQCLSAPTRQDIDKAHRKGRWLDIGVQSLRNLRWTQRWKRAVWCLLGLSSLPLHLLYNSMFYSTIINNDYELYFAHEDWLDGAWYDSWNLPAGGTSRPVFDEMFNETRETLVHSYATAPEKLLASYQHDPTNFEALSPDDCIDAYSKTYLSPRRNVVLVTEHSLNSEFDSGWADNMGNVSNSSSLRAVRQSSDQYELYNKYDRYGWLCNLPGRGEWDENGGCNAAKAKQLAANGNWTVCGWQINSCVSEKLQEKCSVNFNLGIGIVVILANLGKALCIAAVCLLLTDQPLLTVGDAVSSFIRTADPATEGCCLLDRNEMQTQWAHHHRAGTKPPPKAYHTRNGRRAGAAGWKSWTAFLFLLCICLLVVLALLVYAIAKMRKWQKVSFSSLANLGFGAATSETIIEWSIPVRGALLQNVLIANVPQLILSGIYLTLNNLLTRMQLAVEWASYSIQRKGLRVSHDRAGAQRATYFLQLPYRIGLPLMAMSASLHWLVSQSIFLVNINTYDAVGNLTTSDMGNREGDESDITACGFSPLAIVCTLIAGAVVILFMLLLGAQKIPSGGIPLVGSSSIGIAAACHPTKDGSDELQALMWGAVDQSLQEDGADVVVRHCSLSSTAVWVPRDGQLYA